MDVKTALGKNMQASGQKKILLAVSGGIDSMVLLHALYELEGKLHVAHVHHGKRDESDEEETFVTNWCKSRQIPISIKRLNPTTKPDNANFQDWARKERYAFFNAVAEKEGCQHIATAHHFNDKVETFLGHSLRGSGINGLSSLREQEGKIIRPLLNLRYEEIMHYAKENKLEWREDASNKSDDYQRNRIRHHILPKLADVKVNWTDGLANTFENLKDERSLLTELLQKWQDQNVKAVKDELHLSIEAIRQSKAPKALLYHTLRKHDDGFNWDALAHSPNDTVGSFYYGSTHQALRDRKHLIVTLKTEGETGKIIITKNTQTIQNPVSISFNQLHRDQQTEVKRGIANAKVTFSKIDALLDWDKITFPLTLRKWRFGDKFMPLGMKGMKLVSDYLVDKKIPRTQKEKTLVMESEGRIIWLVGHRIDERFKVGAETQKMYLARFLNFEES